jgi:hypothetical protein
MDFWREEIEALEEIPSSPPSTTHKRNSSRNTIVALEAIVDAKSNIEPHAR